jgi:hypothetical protein
MYSNTTTNLIRLGKLSLPGTSQRSKIDRLYTKRFDLLERTVKKGIYKHCPKDLADKAIHGYRRSSGDINAAEQDFLKTDQPYHDLVRDNHYRRALRVTERLFRPSRRLKPIAFPDLRFYPWSLPVSAEAPFTYQKKWIDRIRQRQAEGEDIDGKLTFHNLYNEIFVLNRQLIHQIKDRHPHFWTADGTPIPYQFSALHTRSHLVKQEDEDKLRAVFGVPKLLLMAENMFIWNLQKEYLNEYVKSPMLWGFETFKGGWNRLAGRINSKQPNTVLSTDWSGFDRYALHEVIDDVHQIWRSWFDFDQGYEPTGSTNTTGPRLAYAKTKTQEERIQNLWDWMTYSIKHTPIRAESGNLYKWQYNGIASGFQQTQLLDSFVNCIMILTCLSQQGINIEADEFQIFVQGDDSVTAFQERVFESDPQFVVRMSKDAKRRFNAIIKPEKTTFRPDTNLVEVLSYNNISGIAFREPAELLAHLLYPERNRGAPELAAACIGIAYAAMGSSRHVYDVCRDVFDFLTNQWKVEPDFREYRWLERTGLALPNFTSGEFPTYEETFCQNFAIGGRSERQKQYLWPTKPTGDYGFHFLTD